MTFNVNMCSLCADLLHESIPLYQEQSEEGNTFSADNLFQVLPFLPLLDQ